MKRSIASFLDILLVVALLAGSLLTVPPEPVEAGDLSWSTLPKPVVTEMTTANVFDIAGDGQTIYLFSNGNNTLYKSINAGVSWTAIVVDEDNAILTAISVTKLAVSPLNSNYLFMTDGTDCYFSEDGGLTVEEYNPPAVSGPITDIDIACNFAGYTVLLAATENDVAFCLNNRWYATNSATEAGNKGYLGSISWASNYTVLAAAFSPAFEDDKTLMAVVTNGTDVLVVNYVYATSHDAEWCDSIAITYSYSDDDEKGIRDQGYERADIAFPDDFDGSTTTHLKAFIALIDEYGDSMVCRFAGKAAASVSSRSLMTDLNAESGDIASIAYKGSTGSGILAAAGRQDSTIYTCTSASSDDTPEWIACDQGPRYDVTYETAAETLIKFSPTSEILYAGTDGAPGSAFSRSMDEDFRSFAGIGLISVSDYQSVSMPLGGWKGMGETTQWLKLWDTGAGDYLFFKSINSGITWSLVFDSAGYGNSYFNLFMSPDFSTDQTAYLQASGLDYYLKSTDGGLNWDKLYFAGLIEPLAFAPIDGTSYRIATTAGYRTSSNPEWVSLDGATPLAIIDLPGCLLIWELSGEWWYSLDDGATFLATGADSAIGFSTVFTFGFDGELWTLYEVDNAGNIVSFTLGRSSVWETAIAAEIFPEDLRVNLTGLVKTNTDKLWYFTTDDNDGDLEIAQVWRTTDPEHFDTLPGSRFSNISSLVNSGVSTQIAALPADGGSWQVLICVDGKNTSTGYSNRWLTLTDTALAAPQITSPEDDGEAPNNLTITWHPAVGADRYDVQIDTSPDFGSPLLQIQIEENSWSPPGLSTGTRYYVRIRVAPGEPLASFWSIPVSFTTTGAIPKLTVISPNRNENWLTGSQQEITWLSEELSGNINLLISRDGGLNWSEIITDTPDDGAEVWTVSVPETVWARVKVESVDNPAVFDCSDADFKIDPATPAAWTELPGPELSVMTTANVFDIASDGLTVFLFDNCHATLYKSGDGGFNWSSEGLDSNDVLAGLDPISQLVVNPHNANQILVTDRYGVYFSNNGGQTFAEYVLPALDGFINTIDITSNTSGSPAILVAYEGGVALLWEGLWYDSVNSDGRDLGSATWGRFDGTTEITGQAIGAAFSPDFDQDNTFLAAVKDLTNGEILIAPFAFKSAGGSEWGDHIAGSYSRALGDTIYTVDDQGFNRAMIVFPEDFDGLTPSTCKAFIALMTAERVDSRVYRFDGAATGGSARSMMTDLVAPIDSIYSIDYRGTGGDGTLAFGGALEAAVYTTPEAAGNDSPDWQVCDQAPRYDWLNGFLADTLVKFSPVSATLYAGAESAPGSAFCASAGPEYKAFTGIGMVSISDYANITMSFGGLTGAGEPVQWLKMFDSGRDDYLLFKSSDGGASWQLVFDSLQFNNLMFNLYLSPDYAEDSTVYLFSSILGALNYCIKSCDGGLTWNKMYFTGAEFPYAFTPINGVDYRMATAEGYRTSNNADWVYLDGSTPLAIFEFPGCLLVWEINGEWWYSLDDGVTFQASGADNAIGFTSRFTFGFDGAYCTIYLVDNGGNVRSFTAGQSCAWEYAIPVEDFPEEMQGAVTALAQTGIGEVWYFVTDALYSYEEPSGARTTTQVWRTTDLANFDPLPGTLYTEITSPVDLFGTSTILNAPTRAGLVELFMSVDGTASNSSYANRWLTYTDYAVTYPEIAVEGNSLEIVCGDATPAESNGTDFGTVEVGTEPANRTFTIINQGSMTLYLADDPAVNLSGPEAAGFEVTAQPADTILDPGESTGFSIRFAPAEAGLSTALVSISSSDCNENPFTFRIQGNGLIPGLELTSPAGGEIWPAGSIRFITWSSTGLEGNVNLKVSRDGGGSWSSVASDIADDGEYTWTVSGPAATRARFKVESASDITIYDISAANFTITTLPSDSWLTLNKPRVTEMTTANIFDIAADGQTMYLYSNGDRTLYKSSDAGVHWSSSGLDQNNTLAESANGITRIAVSQYDSNLVAVTDGQDLYLSEDGGATFEVNNPPYLSGPITDIDISFNAAGYPALLAATENSVAFCLNNRWYETNSGYDVNEKGYLGGYSWHWGYQPIAAAFSPDFHDDSTFLVVVKDWEYGEILVLPYVYLSSNDAEWGDTIAVSYSSAMGDSTNLVTDAGYETADIVFPDDFDGSTTTGLKAFIALVNSSGDSAIYRFTGKWAVKASSRSILNNLNAESGDIASIAYKGTTSGGTLAVAAYFDSTVYTCSGASSDDTPEWVGCDQKPRYDISYGTPARTMIKFSPVSNTLYAGTDGAPGSAFSASVDENYQAFVGIAMISVSGYANISLPLGSLTGVGGTTQWQRLTDSGYYDDLLFKTTDGGDTWQMVYDSAGYDNPGFTVQPSPSFVTDSTVYLKSFSSDDFVKSSDGGYSWSKIKIVNSEEATAFAPVNGTDYRIANTAGYRTSSNPQWVYLDGGLPIAIIDLPGCLLVWELSGEWWYSLDDGATFHETGADTAIGYSSPVTFGLGDAGWSIYVVDSSGSIRSYTPGQSTGWDIAIPAAAFPVDMQGNLSAIVKTGFGDLWYFATDDNAGERGISQVWRTTDLENFEAISGTQYSSIRSLVDIAGVAVMLTAHFQYPAGIGLYICVDGTETAGNYANKQMLYIDSSVFESETAALEVSVGLQGGLRPEDGWEIPLTVKLFSHNTSTPTDIMTAEPLYTFDLFTTLSGTAAIAQAGGIAPGTYDVSVTSPHCLTNVWRGLEIVAPGTSVNLGVLLEGNSNDDDVKINIQDFGILAATYGKTADSEEFNEQADFDRNDEINIADFGLLSANYGRSSPIDVTVY